MPNRPLPSRRRYQRYKQEFAEHRTEGTSRTAQAHAKAKGKAAASGGGRRRRGQRSAGQLIRAFFSMLAGHRAAISGALALLTVATVLKLVPVYGIKITIDNVLQDHPLPDALTAMLDGSIDRRTLLGVIAIGIVILAVLSILIGMISRWTATRITKQVQVNVRRRAYEHAVRLPMHRIQRIKSGGVASVLREDAGGIADLIFGMLYNPWKAVIQLLGCLLILATIDWRLLAGSLLILPVVYITHRTWIARIRPMWRDIRASRQMVDAHAAESFGGIRVVRTFNRERSEAARFTRNNHFMARQELAAWWWSRGTDIAWSVLIPLASALLLWFGGSRVLADMARVEAGAMTLEQAMTAGDLVMFLAYLGMLLEPIATLATSATMFQNNLAGLDRVLDLYDEPLEDAAQSGARRIAPAKVRGRITFDGVNFAYPGAGEQVLHDVSFEAEPGWTVALVGPSGAGKTTLCNLIARLYLPTDGAVRLDGVDLREIDIDAYRRLLGIVEQDIFLFDGTVAENIGYGDRDATMNDITEAARRANAHGFITEFERGYETIIGERGVRLSGGQRQRIAIARAILADPRILILDEATSNLDTESERLIQASLRTLLRDRTSFVIAHRLSTIRHADQIIVIDHGRIVEQGTHDELMTVSGRYRAMVRMQLGDGRESEIDDDTPAFDARLTG